MKADIPLEAARYYDSSPELPNDIPFYQGLITSPDISILELGCGTGRVTLALVPNCKYMQGIEISSNMLSIARDKLQRAGIPPTRARVDEGNIADFDLGRKFDLIIAPFRVFQNLDADSEVDGLFRCIRDHLSVNGTCILNTARPSRSPEELRARWSNTQENKRWETPVEGGRLVCYDRKGSMNMERTVLYPDLIYRKYAGDNLVEESVFRIVMRYYHPDAFEKLITDHGFAILKRWGGYQGEVYGQGPELVIQFAEGSAPAARVGA